MKGRLPLLGTVIIIIIIIIIRFVKRQNVKRLPRRVVVVKGLTRHILGHFGDGGLCTDCPPN